MRLRIPFAALLGACLVLFSGPALAAKKAKPPLDVLFASESRLVMGSLVEKNPAGRLVFKREKVYGQSTDVPELVDVRVGQAELDSARIGQRYVLGYSLFHRDKQSPGGIAANRKGAILIHTSGLEPALFEDSRRLQKILDAAETWEGRRSDAMKRLLSKALAGPDPSLQLLAAAQFTNSPELGAKLDGKDRRALEAIARDAGAKSSLRELLFAAASEQPAAYGNWAQSLAFDLLASTPLDGYAPGAADLSTLVLLAFDESMLHHFPVPYDSLVRWLHSPQRLFVERSTALLGAIHPTRQANALEEALGESSLSSDTRKYLDDQLRIIRGQEAGADAQQHGPG